MNQKPGGGVLSMNGRMHALADSLQGPGTRLVTRDESLEREFEARLADSGTLAFRVTYAVLRNRADAEDVAQEALVRAYQRFHALRDRERFRAWLVRICWRLALDHRRGAKRRETRETTAMITIPAQNVEDVAAQNEFQRRLFAAMDELPEKFRIVLVLSGIQGYDTREVASLLEVPEGTVKSRLHTASAAVVAAPQVVVTRGARRREPEVLVPAAEKAAWQQFMRLADAGAIAIETRVVLQRTAIEPIEIAPLEIAPLSPEEGD